MMNKEQNENEIQTYTVYWMPQIQVVHMVLSSTRGTLMDLLQVQEETMRPPKNTAYNLRLQIADLTDRINKSRDNFLREELAWKVRQLKKKLEQMNRS